MIHKIIILILAFGLFLAGSPAYTYAQDDRDNPNQQTLVNPAAKLDFWLGRWDLAWKDKDGKTGTGSNEITKILNDKVIQENFRALTGGLRGFTGKSWSVYDVNQKKWFQTWVDTNGAYLAFEGEFDGKKRIFKREFIGPKGKKVMQRMVFYNITKDAFTWDWESSPDNGETWKLSWRINYKRHTQKTTDKNGR